MAVYADQPSRPRRFMKVYLAIWALLAIGALGYLSHLALQAPLAPQVRTAEARVPAAEADPNQAMRALAKTTIEMGTIRRGLSDVQKDIADLKEAASEREAKQNAVTTRLSAVEEKLATMQTAAEAVETPAKGKISERHQRKSPEPKIIARAPQETAAPAAPPSLPQPTFKEDGPPVPLETGSIASKETITFGEPVVTRSGGQIAFAVQLAAGPSLPGLRQSWSQLRERHGALAGLEPRVVPPRNDGGPYRLLAGPFTSRADADRVCTEMGVGRNGCYVTTYIGTPL